MYPQTSKKKTLKAEAGAGYPTCKYRASQNSFVMTILGLYLLTFLSNILYFSLIKDNNMQTKYKIDVG